MNKINKLPRTRKVKGHYLKFTKLPELEAKLKNNILRGKEIKAEKHRVLQVIRDIESDYKVEIKQNDFFSSLKVQLDKCKEVHPKFLERSRNK